MHRGRREEVTSREAEELGTLREGQGVWSLFPSRVSPGCLFRVGVMVSWWRASYAKLVNLTFKLRMTRSLQRRVSRG